MKREINFRAWHKTLNVMLNVYVIDQTQNSYNEYYSRCKGFYGENNQVTFKYDEVEWMQFTGLSDKTNEYIFEGDIVDVVNESIKGNINFYCQTQPKIGDKYIVICLQSGFTLRPMKTYLSLPDTHLHISNLAGQIINYDFWNGHRFIQVIGNIYENPELLNP